MWNWTLVAFAIYLLTVPGVYGQRGKRATLLPEGAAHEVSALCSRDRKPKVDGGWQPTSSDIETMETHFSRIGRLAGNHTLLEDRIAHPSRFFRQYVGVVIGGRRFIYINGICGTKPPKQWREHLVNDCDGGCNWGVLYDPMSGQFSDFDINGIA